MPGNWVGIGEVCNIKLTLQVMLFSQGAQNPITLSHMLLSGFFQTRFAAKHLTVNVTQGRVQRSLSQAGMVCQANLAASSFWTMLTLFLESQKYNQWTRKILISSLWHQRAQPGSHHDSQHTTAELVAAETIKPKPAESVGCSVSNRDVSWDPAQGSNPALALPFRGPNLGC